MAGYMAMARVQGGRVRALAWDGDPAVDPVVPDVRSGSEATTTVEDAPAPTLLERWQGVRDEVGMMTFFLLDPESWR